MAKEQLEDNLIGRSEWVMQARHRLRQLAETDIAVYLHGERGTGRTLAACYMHRLSSRHAQPIIFGDILEDQDAPLNEWIAQAQGGTLVLRNIEFLTGLSSICWRICRGKTCRHFARSASGYSRRSPWPAITALSPIYTTALP